MRLFFWVGVRTRRSLWVTGRQSRICAHRHIVCGMIRPPDSSPYDMGWYAACLSHLQVSIVPGSAVCPVNIIFYRGSMKAGEYSEVWRERVVSSRDHCQRARRPPFERQKGVLRYEGPMPMEL